MKRKKVLMIIILIIFLVTIFALIDYCLVNNNKKPWFSITRYTLNNYHTDIGTSGNNQNKDFSKVIKIYNGLGYTIKTCSYCPAKTSFKLGIYKADGSYLDDITCYSDNRRTKTNYVFVDSKINTINKTTIIPKLSDKEIDKKDKLNEIIGCYSTLNEVDNTKKYELKISCNIEEISEDNLKKLYKISPNITKKELMKKLNNEKNCN